MLFLQSESNFKKNLKKVLSAKVVMTIVLVISMTLVMAACGSNDQTQETTAPDSGASETTAADSEGGNNNGAFEPSENGYYFQHSGAKMVMHAKVEPLLQQLGEESTYFEAESCAFQGLDKIYTYPGFELMTYPIDEVDYVSAVILMDDSVATPEGLYIGSDEAEVVELLGDDYTKDHDAYVYVRDQSQLMVMIEDGVVVSIEYTAITE